MGFLVLAQEAHSLGQVGLMSKTVTLQPVEAVAIDTYLEDGDTSANTDNLALRVGFDGSANESRFLIEWDLLKAFPESVSAHSVESVTLTLNHRSDYNFTSSHTKTLELSVVDGSFGEDATWINRTTGTAWSSAGGDLLTGPGVKSTTYTGDSNLVITSSSDVSGSLLRHVRDALQTKGKKYRMAVVMSSGGPNRYVNFWSSNATDSADAPSLQITYQTARGMGITATTIWGKSRSRRAKRAGRKH